MACRKTCLHREPLCWETRHPYPVNESLPRAHVLFTTKCLGAEIWGSEGGCPSSILSHIMLPWDLPLQVPLSRLRPQVEARSCQGLRSQAVALTSLPICWAHLDTGT